MDRAVCAEICSLPDVLVFSKKKEEQLSSVSEKKASIRSFTNYMLLRMSAECGTECIVE